MAREVEPGRIEVVDRRVAEILRAKTPAERVDMMFQASRLTREMLTARLCHEHPEWTLAQTQAEIPRRILNGSTNW
jgi:hypothetical protein